MRVCLISAPTVSDFGERARFKNIRRSAAEVPLSVLALAAVLEQSGIEVTVLESNSLFYDFLESPRDSEEEFSAFIARRVPAGCDAVGLSTICSTYPLTIRTAEEIRRLHPEYVIILGGPQASAVDVASLRAFPFVDAIVRGEAEMTLPMLLRTGLRSPAIDSVPGVTYRDGNQITRNPDPPVLHDLDALPMPAFHLLPDMASRPCALVESGRGCPFTCSFCSTNEFFRRRSRLRSPAVLISQMRTLHRAYGTERFQLVHDMFTVDRKRVLAFCDALMKSGERFKWMCSARTDCIDKELIGAMAAAGCDAIFLGIETGSKRLQRAINKCLDLEQAAERVRMCCEAGMVTTVSMIAGFPSETPDDVDDTVNFLMDAARFENLRAHLHLLAPLAQTPLEREHRAELTFDSIMSDVSQNGWKQEAADLALITAHPEIFPNFYSIPTPHLDRGWLKRLREFTLHALEWCRWLMVGLHQWGPGHIALFERWEAWCPPRPQESGPGLIEWTRYYASAQFRDDFLRFVRETEPWPAEAAAALAALLEFETKFREPRLSGGASTGAPRLREGVRLVRMSIDVRPVFDALRSKGSPPLPRRRRNTLATRPKHGGVEIVQLGSLAAWFLERCDGVRTVAEIARELPRKFLVDGASAEEICLVALESAVQGKFAEGQAKPLVPQASSCLEVAIR